MMAEEIFQRAPTPRRHRGHALARYANWYTWSPWAISLFRQYGPRLRQGRPTLQVVRSCKPYGATYDLPLPARHDELRQAIDALAGSLFRVQLDERMLLLRDVLGPHLERAQLHRLLALLRGSLVEIAGDARASLYSPASPARGKRNDFALHADLFVVDRLLLVFDDVPADGSGRSIFLSRATFVSLLERVRTLSAAGRARISGLLTAPIRRDSFNRLYSLLHGDHPWRDELARALAQDQLAIGLGPGEGYLLNDRHWLHGREAVSRPVGGQRFRRLVFGQVQVGTRASPSVDRRRGSAPGVE
jgi:hypothetical protein